MNPKPESSKRRWLWNATSVSLLIVWGTGQILRDRSWLLGLMFYIPSTLVTVWYALSGIWLAYWQRRGSTNQSWRLHALLCLPPLLCVLLVENQWVQPASAEPVTGDVANAASEVSQPLRLVHWNLQHSFAGWEKQRDVLRELNADVIVLSEATGQVRDDDFADFTVVRCFSMLIACRGSMTASRSLLRGGALDAFHVRCELDNVVLEIMIADMTSNLNVWRDLYLQPFIRTMSERQIDIAVGDLNAPRRSLAFSNLPEGYRHAYDAAGAGWSSTWPVPVPMLAIDQCICGPDIQPVKYVLQSSALSDHRLQILDFRKSIR